ncbi:hypothetical protein J2848_001042 [Azospirillum lipoferum]|uniref:Lipoprotein n=1 Tax=Azospirillum lipoferum TaxID=193 RepID=A0A5A9GVR7_AZOLI|nr:MULTISPECIES: hypothetical protein [Azospirillum]KAA0598591.1 hypothetical protein FZ942_05840 [Azospirillum lipoferum]MCP1609395.1 hypothetical protein [Azospirillum lipoferum]MDW5535296.1 hypothetical protein [Azospirillum sp. NL1]
MKTALRFVIAAAMPLALAACNQTSSNSSGGGLFGGSGGGLFGSGESDSYARNGRCDDPRYNTSNGGRAEAGTDDYDCSRYGNGLKR